MKLLSRKIKTVKRVLHGFRVDFTDWKSEVQRQKHELGKLKNKVDKIDEKKAELDLSQISTRATVSVGDVVKSMLTLQENMMAKVVTTADHESLKQQL